jgi:hypothetical protein
VLKSCTQSDVQIPLFVARNIRFINVSLLRLKIIKNFKIIKRIKNYFNIKTKYFVSFYIKDGQSRFQTLSKKQTVFCKDPEEYICTGKEVLQDITVQKPSKKGNLLWATRFQEFKNPKLVRPELMAYYWPVESVMFLGILERRQERKFFAEQNLGNQKFI